MKFLKLSVKFCTNIQVIKRCCSCSPNINGTLDQHTNILNSSKRTRNICTFLEGELVLTTDRKRRRNLFKLQYDGLSHFLHTKISHNQVIGRTIGSKFPCSDLMLWRPSLEEYVMHMERSAAASNPTDIAAIMTMADIGPGCTVLEAGTGSGAMTLYLSRAVGPNGCVHTFEKRERHLNTAQKNYKGWLESWNISHSNQPWLDNVTFHNKNISTATEDMFSAQDVVFDAVVLDLLNPELILESVAKLLVVGKPVVLFIPNITQVVETVEVVRSQRLPFIVERVIEVHHRKWTVKRASERKGIMLPDNLIQEDIPTSHPYVARPSHDQQAHTGFLIHLKKFESHSSSHQEIHKNEHTLENMVV